MIKRTYHLLGKVSREDIEFLYRAKVDFYQEPLETRYEEYRGLHHLIDVSNPKLIITLADTMRDNKLETWLKLNFGDRLLFVAEEVMYKYY